MARSVKRLPPKHWDLSLNPSTEVTWYSVACLHHNTGEAKAGGTPVYPIRPKWSPRFSKRPRIKTKIECNWEKHLTPASGLHIHTHGHYAHTQQHMHTHVPHSKKLDQKSKTWLFPLPNHVHADSPLQLYYIHLRTFPTLLPMFLTQKTHRWPFLWHYSQTQLSEKSRSGSLCGMSHSTYLHSWFSHLWTLLTPPPSSRDPRSCPFPLITMLST